MINIETEDETLKFFQKINDENWISDTELFERGYELNKNKENCEKMKIIRAARKFGIKPATPSQMPFSEAENTFPHVTTSILIK